MLKDYICISPTFFRNFMKGCDNVYERKKMLDQLDIAILELKKLREELKKKV